MRTHRKRWGKVLVAALVIALSAPHGVLGGTNEAVEYLKSQTQSPWTTMALVAAGESPSLDYLKTKDGDTALALETPIMAITAGGEDPRIFGDIDLVEKLKTFADGIQIGDPGLINDDIFGILALIGAGEETSDSIIQNAKEFIISNQRDDGSWGYGTTGPGDTNTTAAAIMALKAAGVSTGDHVIQNAVTYLKGAQNSDGGFPYDPHSSYGTSSDASSDAWVASAFYAAGEDAGAAIAHLESLQQDGGFFVNQAGGEETSFTPTETAYALIALSGASYPVRVIEIEAPLVRYRIEGGADTVCGGETRAKNAMEIVEVAAGECGYTYEIQQTDFGPYLTTIGSDVAEGVAGWLYTVNLLPGSEINVGAKDYILEEGDSVLWYYGDWTWSLLDIEVSSLEVAAGEEVTVTVTKQEGGGWVPIEGAEIEGAGETLLTNANGTISFTPQAGVTILTAAHDGYVRSKTLQIISGDKQEFSIPLEITIEEGGDNETPPTGGGGQEAAFVLKTPEGETPEFRFPEARRGEALQEMVTIINNGETKLHVESIVEGDDIFRDYLELDNTSWRTFEAEIGAGTSKDTEVEVQIPAHYNGEGRKTGTLIFWVIASE